MPRHPAVPVQETLPCQRTRMFDPANDIDWRQLRALDVPSCLKAEELEQVMELARQAERFLLRFNWCAGIGRGGGGGGGSGIVSGRWLGEWIPTKVGVFLFQAVIREGWENLDEWQWIVVGDLPPARLSPWYARNWCQAVNCYCGEMQAWVDAVRAGEPVDKLIPVNVERTSTHADMLESRLRTLDEFLVEPVKHLLEARVAADREEPPAVRGPGS